MADSTQLSPQTIEMAVRSAFDNEIVSNACMKFPLVGFIMARFGKPTRSRGIRIPDDGILSGANIPQLLRKQVASHTWEPAVHTSLPADDTKVMAWYDTTPDDNTGGAAGPMSRMKRARFRRTDLATPITVWTRDLRQLRNAFKTAMTTGNRAAADAIADDITDLCRVASVEKMVNQLSRINAMFWATDSDGPSDEELLLWDRQHSLRSSLGVNNVYGGIDRSAPGNAFWRGNVVSGNMPADMEGLFNYMQYTGLGLNNKGIKPNLWVVGNVLFPIFKAQARARDLKVYRGDEIPDVPVFGQKQEAIRLNGDTFIINDPSCPAKGINGATKNAMVCLSTDRLVVSFFPDANFAVSPFYDEANGRSGGREAITSRIRTEFGFWVREPWAHVWFDDIG